MQCKSWCSKTDDWLSGRSWQVPPLANQSTTGDSCPLTLATSSTSSSSSTSSASNESKTNNTSNTSSTPRQSEHNRGHQQASCPLTLVVLVLVVPVAQVVLVAHVVLLAQVVLVAQVTLGVVVYY